MQVKTSVLVQFLMAGLVGAMIWRYSVLATRPFFADRNGVVIVIKTNEEPLSFGTEIWQGADAARKLLAHPESKLEAMDIDVTGGSDPGDAPITFQTRLSIRRRILERLARGGVLGFISSGSSAVDREIAKTLATLRVPLLITGATNPDVLPGGNQPTVARLIGTNDQEGDQIVEWIQQYHYRAAVLYQPSAYGTDLATKIAKKASDKTEGVDVLPFPVASPSALADLGKLQETYHFDAFVIIAYPPTLEELVAAVSMLKKPEKSKRSVNRTSTRVPMAA